MFASLLNFITDFWICLRLVYEPIGLFLDLAGISRSIKNMGIRGKKVRLLVNSRVISQELKLRISKRKIDMKRCPVCLLFSKPQGFHRVIYTRAQSSPEDCHQLLWQCSVFLWSLQSHRTDSSHCGWSETQRVHSGDVSENALYVTYTRRERESACFEKRLCWCSPAFFINFILTLHPRCISQLPKLFSRRSTGRDTPHHMAPEKAARWHSPI